MSFVLKSNAFEASGEIPKEYTGESADVSPPLEWHDPPEDTEQFALICEDPDAPLPKPFTHWLLYRIPGSLRAIHESVPAVPEPPLVPGARQGLNSFGRVGYRGPMPPVGHGWHRYVFTLYALDEALELPAGMSKDELVAKIDPYILGKATYIGRFRREAREAPGRVA
jgi:Raf kinase inhibitor-like YbhB/YbcL family protein